MRASFVFYNSRILCEKLVSEMHLIPQLLFFGCCSFQGDGSVVVH